MTKIKPIPLFSCWFKRCNDALMPVDAIFYIRTKLLFPFIGTHALLPAQDSQGGIEIES
jgi:hypothetical protein